MHDVKRQYTLPIEHSLSNISILPHLQPKLKINTPGDPYEMEADRMAEQVVAMPQPTIQRKCSSCGKEEEEHIQRKPLVNRITQLPANGDLAPMQRKCAQCQQEEEEEIQTKSNGQSPSVADSNLTSKIEQTRGLGKPMDANTRSFMELRFGADFSRIKIHADSDAAQMNRQINARAFTVGNDIYFNAGQHETTSTEGKNLLAHELTHTLQQNYWKIPTDIHDKAYKGAGNLSEAKGELLQLSPDDPHEIAERIRTFIHTPDPVAGPSLAYRAFPILAGLDDSTLNLVLSLLSAVEITELIVSDSTDKTERISAALAVASQGAQPAPTAPAPTTVAPFPQVDTTTGATLGAVEGHTVQAFFFQGTSNRKALIIGGVHGSEPGGVEVVRNLLAMLQIPGAPIPFFSVVIVPALFEANVSSSRPLWERRTSGGNVRSLSARGAVRNVPTPDPNRQFPAVGADPTTDPTLGCVVDEQNRCIEPENLVLLDLINRFQPERVANVHGHSPQPRERLLTHGGPSITTDPRPGQESEDDALTLTMAREAQRRGVRVPGNFLGTPDQTTRYPTSTAPSLSAGITLGGWGSHATPTRPAMNIVLIETYGNRTSASGSAAARAARRIELMNLAEILRDFFLVDPASTSTTGSPSTTSP